MRKFSKVVRLPEFEGDMKKLSRRFRTLEDDLDVFIDTALDLYHKLRVDYAGIVQISRLGIETPIYKAIKFACRSLKGKGARSGIRVIYTYHKDTDTIELIEIYHKADKENENRERILRYYT